MLRTWPVRLTGRHHNPLGLRELIPAAGSNMTNATEIEHNLTRARPWFTKWRRAGEFVRQVDALAELIPSDQYWTRGCAKWLREAWSLARYSEEPSRVAYIRLSKSDPPDAYVCIGGEEIPIEVTFGLAPGRRIGDEYKEAVRLVHYEPDECRILDMRKVLEVRIADKAIKSYPQGTILLVDLEMSDLAACHSSTEMIIREIVARPYPSFRAIQVLWKNQIYGLP